MERGRPIPGQEWEDIDLDQDEENGQWLSVHANSDDSPEIDLLRTLLRDAIAVYLKGTKGSEQEEEWIMRTDTYFLSFISTCEILGLDPSRLRVGILDMKRRKLTLKNPRVKKAKST